MTDETSKKQRPSADETRKSILSAALELFAKQGFSGTSISDLAGRSGSNPSLIYHHFENKEGLWHTVIVNILQQHFSLELLENFERFDDYKDFVNEMVRNFFHFFDTHKDVCRMLQWQALEDTELKHIRLEDSLERVEKWRAALHYFQKQGQLRDDIDADMILRISNNLTTSYFMSSYPALASLDHAADEDSKQQYLEIIIGMLVCHLAVHK